MSSDDADATMDDTDDDHDHDHGLVVGPDLDPTRSSMDKKTYRHVTLSNGLKCVLICDVAALRQRRLEGRCDGGDEEESDDDDEEDDEEDEDADDDDGDEDDHDDEDEDEDEDEGPRKAAAALLVNVGSYHDPPNVQGLSHFLEHMLFLGTKDFPTENAYDSFLAKKGGDDNAYTDMEHTLYHFCIPQDSSDGENNVWKALTMFASFFKCPLLTKDGADRELRAVESEFELNKKDDDCRRSQLMGHTCGMDGDAPIMMMGREEYSSPAASSMGKEGGSKMKEKKKPFHPFAKFPWGNKESLKAEPESAGVDVMGELRNFYDAHYYARNMRLVVVAGYELDEIQRRVVRTFGDVPADPRIVSNEGGVGNVVGGGGGGVTHLRPYGLPFHPPSSLAKVYRIVPVRRSHTLVLTWQMPPVGPHWRSKPANYLAHLLGHEASGSVLSALRTRGWATGLSAGTGDDGLGDASTHALFGMEISLSKVGMGRWEDVVEAVFAYVGMLKFRFLEGHRADGNDDENGERREGLPSWIYDELKSIAEMSYRYADEGDVTDIVEEVAESMAPWYNLPEERILDGDALLFDDVVDNDVVKSLLFDYFTPKNTRVDLMSSMFGLDADYGASVLKGEEEKKEESEDGEGSIESMDTSGVDDDSDDEDEEALLFDREKAGPPSIEPRFDTKFWVEDIPNDVLQQWADAARPELPSADLAMSLPPKNAYIPTKFDLKPPPADDADHPLLDCSVKVCVTVGRQKSWFPAAVTRYKTEKNVHRLSLSYEDEGEKWHMLDFPESYNKFEGEGAGSLEAGHEGSLDGCKIKFRVTAVPREGEGIVFSYGDSGHDDDVDDGVAFPPIPPAAPASRLPALIHDKHSVKVWHLQDRKFKRPQADLRIRFECEGMNDSALNQGCMALFCKLCADALTETCYLASVCELDSSMYPTDTGFSIRVHGFDDNLLALAKEVLRVVMSFRGRDAESDLPHTIKDGRFDACLELLTRKYSNAGMDASSFSSGLRLLLIRPSAKSAFSKLKSLQNLTVGEFVRVMSRLLKRLSVESFIHGNVDRKDADEASNMISEALTPHHVGIPKKKLPSKLVIKAKQAVDNHQIVVPTIDSEDPNTAVEVYFQFGRDDNSSDAIQQRVLADLLEHILGEPLYNQIRTKEQFGYEVSCGARWTYGILGMSFRVVTSCKSAEEASSRIDDFLKSFRSELVTMDDETFMEHLVGLAKNKLESFDSMDEETSSHWSEIIEGRYDFETYRKEVLCLRSLTKEQVISAYDDWLHPLCKNGRPKKRRRIVLHVIGSGDAPASLGRPLVQNEKAVGDEIDQLVNQFHTSVKCETWGRVSFGTSELRRGNTV